MRILHITSSFYPYLGGMELAVEHICHNQSKMGHEVLVLTSNHYCEDQLFKKTENYNGYKIRRVKSKLFLKGYGYAPDFKKELLKTLKEFSPDIVHVHCYRRYITDKAAKILEKKNVKTIFTAHGGWIEDTIIKRIYSRLRSKQIRKFDYFHILTPQEKQFLINKGISKNIFQIPLGISVSSDKQEAEKILKRLKKENKTIKRPILIFVGRIHHTKRLKVVLEALINLNAFLIASTTPTDSEYELEIQELLKEKNMQSKLLILPPMEQKRLFNFFEFSDLFVMPSRYESFCLSCLEAAALGMPVVSSDTGIAPQIVVNGENGYLLDCDADGKDWELSLKKALENLKTLKENANKKAKKIKKEYSWGNTATKLVEVYNLMRKEQERQSK